MGCCNKPTPNGTSPLDLSLITDLISHEWDYNIIGHSNRIMNFATNQQITTGKGQLEEEWFIKDGVLHITYSGTDLCRLQKIEKGWIGEWLAFEKFPILLTQTKELEPEEKMKPYILFKYPTRSRPEIYKKTLTKWINLSSNKYDYAWWITCDTDDDTMNNDEIRHWTANLAEKTNNIHSPNIHYSTNKSKIEAINKGLTTNPDSRNVDIIVLVSDDMTPQVQGYDEVIVNSFANYFPNYDGMIWFNDGRAHQLLNTLSIMGWNYFTQFGYIYHPSYSSVWSDNEQMDVARELKKIKYIDQVIIKHDWVDLTGCDPLYQRNEKFYKSDEENYKRRKQLGFPKDVLISLNT